MLILWLVQLSYQRLKKFELCCFNFILKFKKLLGCNKNCLKNVAPK